MSTRTTLVLLALLILVGFAVYFIEFRKPAGGAVATPNAAGSATLLTLTAPAINSITVRDAVSNTQVSATRDVSSTWRLSDPAGQLADAATMDSLIGRLASLYVQRTLTPTGGLGEYGLLTPTLSVQIDLVSGSLSFAVGDMTPSQGAYYVQKSGDTHVYLVETGLVDDLRKLAQQPPLAATPTPASAFPAPVGP
jgi:hypothetical protein